MDAYRLSGYRGTYPLKRFPLPVKANFERFAFVSKLP